MRRMKNKNYCEHCPMAWCTRDYWGEYDEGCELYLESYFDGEDYKWICKMPNFIKKIYQKYNDWKLERCLDKIIIDYKDKEIESDGKQ